MYTTKEDRHFEADKPWSDEDIRLISELRKATASIVVDSGDEAYWRSDLALHRFLVARSMKVDAAAKQYEHSMAIRREHKCSLLLTRKPDGVMFYSQPEVMRKCFPWGIVGLDKQGFPVLVEKIGSIDLVGMQTAIGPDQFIHWVGICFIS